MASPNPMDKAAAAFKKEERAREGAKAMTEYRAAQLAEEKKTERLRALRLAQEAQEATAGQEPAPERQTARPEPKKSRPRKRA